MDQVSQKNDPPRLYIANQRLQFLAGYGICQGAQFTATALRPAIAQMQIGDQHGLGRWYVQRARGMAMQIRQKRNQPAQLRIIAVRTLLIRPGAIGDCIAALPVLRHLSTPETEIWVPTAIQGLVQFGCKVRSIASTGLDLLGLGDLPPPGHLIIRLRDFDSIISWYGANRSEFRETVAGLGLPFTFHAALPTAANTLQITDFLAQQVNAPAGLIPEIDVPAAPLRQTIVIHPFSGGVRKNWPLERFRELARRCELPVEWSAGPGEILPEATRFDNLLDLAVWLKGTRLYIGNDSGITHLAAALGIPVIALFSATDPQIWQPRGKAVNVMQSEPSGGFSLDAILAEVHRLLATFPASSAR